MGVIRYKIWRDLWSNKARTLQVVLIIGMGAFAIGMIITTRNLVVEGMQEIWQETKPAMIGMWLSPGIDENALIGLERVPGVTDIEGFMVNSVEWRLGPDDEWHAGDITAREDYENYHFFKLDLLSGDWPSTNTLVVGQGTDTVFGAYVGEQVTVRVNGRSRVYTIGGALSDPVVQPPSFGGNAQFYASKDTFEEIFNDLNYNRILAGAAQYDEVEIVTIANRLRDKLEKQNVDSGGYLPPAGDRIVNPEKHFFQDTMDAIFLILGVMAALALFLGLFLVYNTINAIISQQVDQIGVMKAIGAHTGQILLIYLLYVFSFGLLSLLLAVPLGVLGGWGLTVFLMDSFNADPGSFAISWQAVYVQVFLALILPMLVALVPVFSGARISVREAVTTYGLSLKPTLLDRLIARMKHVSRLLLLTVSNTFRHKSRVFLTQITLVLSGLIFMMVMSVGDSTTYTFNNVLFTILNSDINMGFEDAERINYIETLTRLNPEVERVEMWAFGGGSIRPREQPESDDDPNVLIFGVEPDTGLYGYQMRNGRWLDMQDRNTVVLNQELARDLGVNVGDWVTFDQGSTGESDWEIVGLLSDPMLTTSAHVPREVLLWEQVSVGRTNTIWVKLKHGDAATEQRVAKELRQLYESKGIDMLPGGILNRQDTSSGVINNLNTQFQAIVMLLATMAVVIGMVGSISLSGVVSLSVIERQREIGVMRAIGASSWDISRMFIGESLILGWLSWLIAFPLSLPAGRVMTEALSSALGFEIVYHYTLQGPFIWLGIITVLAALASWLPARRATHISVQQSLSYQ